MFISKIVSGSLAGLLLLVGSHSATAGDPAAVRDMMHAMGMVEQYADMGEGWRKSILETAQTDPSLPRDLMSALADISAEAFEGTRFVRDLEVALAETLSDDEIAAVTAFYKTSLGETIRELEVAAAQQGAIDEVAANVPVLRARLELTPDRLALFQKLDDALFISEISATFVTGLLESIEAAVSVNQGIYNDKDARSAAAEKLSNLHSSILPDIREHVLATFEYAYRDMSHAQLEQYAEFLLSNPARAANAAILAGVTEIFEARGREIGTKLAEYIRQKEA